MACRNRGPAVHREGLSLLLRCTKTQLLVRYQIARCRLGALILASSVQREATYKSCGTVRPTRRHNCNRKSPQISRRTQHITMEFKGVRIAGKPEKSRWDLCCENGCLKWLTEHESTNASQPDPRVLCPSLCHPHIHLDKCFLLSHPNYSDLEIQKGDFPEALRLTSR